MIKFNIHKIYMVFAISFVVLCSSVTQAKTLVSDLSQHEILVDAGFSGKNIFLFGVRNLAGDIVVAIRGPKQDYIVRKKEKIWGVWLNKKQMEFRDVYGFYAVYSTVPISKIKESVLRNLNIGVDNLPFDYTGKAYIEEIGDFRKAILENKLGDQLYFEKFEKMNFMGDDLFKTDLQFPKKIPHGLYNAEIYLINGSNLVGVQSIPIEVRKTGFESMVYDFAHNNGFLYGIFCVLAAIFAGWLANIIFWKV